MNEFVHVADSYRWTEVEINFGRLGGPAGGYAVRGFVIGCSAVA